MKFLLTIGLALILTSFTVVYAAEGEEAQQQQEQQLEQERQSMLKEAERTREEAENARREAARAAERARESAMLSAQMAREEAEMLRQENEERAHEKRQQREESGREREMQREEMALERERMRKEMAQQRAAQEEEMARAREELSKAHRELREAQREVASAHREVSRAHRDVADDERVIEIVQHVNLGDRAVIGVVLGTQTDKGVKLMGVSPDGPAERAGLQQGDILTSIRGIDLRNNDEARQDVFEVMSEVEEGEELSVEVERDGESWAFTVVPEQREPRSWQSVIRIPEVGEIEDVPGVPHVAAHRIVIPEIDEEALAAEVAELAERMKEKKFMYITAGEAGDEHHRYRFEYDFETFSDLGAEAMSEANIWFGLPQAHGLQLAPVNEGLGRYFKTDRGVLVIQAREDNAYQLESGDVILAVDSGEVNSPSDLMRALREVKPGSEIEIEIKRQKKNRTISVVMPENRLGYR